MIGVRSPVALELVRQLHFHGLVVEGADFLHFPLGRFSRRLTRYYRLPSPRWRQPLFKQAVEHLMSRSYSTVFACNEEIFWLSQCAAGVWERLEILEKLHRKDAFVRLLEESGLPAPSTVPLEEWKGGPEGVVLKRVYSRFGESTWLEPDFALLERLRGESGWLVQRKLGGAQICFSGFAWKGELLCGCCYESRWGRLRGAAHGGAGLYFHKCTAPELEEQARKLVRDLAFSGPIGLDFVGGVAVECNPRWTSGIHLLDLTPMLTALGLPTRSGWVAPEQAQLAAAMLLRSGITQDFMRARDIVWDAQDWGPALAQPLALAELLWRSQRRKISLSRAMTWDIEWNGIGDIAGM